MRGTTSERLRVVRPGGHGAGWLNLGWKVLLALSILLLMLIGIPVSGALVWTLVGATLLAWGGLFAGIASSNLFEGSLSLRVAWGALAVGAYGALALSGVIVGPSRMADALGPVAALTLAAGLGRKDLSRALRDWALVMALALYAALGVQAMWLFATGLGLVAFLVAALFPPLIFEAIMLLLRRAGGLRERLRSGIALLLATLIGVVVVSFTQFNSSIPLGWSLIFHLIVGILIGGALLVGLLTRPLIEAASGAHQSSERSVNMGRALVELSHGPMLIALIIYIPLRLLGMTTTG